MRKKDRLLRPESLIIRPGAHWEGEFGAFEEWLYGLEGEEKERCNQSVSAFCLQEMGQPAEEILDEAAARLKAGEKRSSLPGLDAIMFFNFAYYKARQAVRGRDGQ